MQKMVIVGYATKERDKMAVGIVSTENSKYFHWCKEGTFQIDPIFEKQELKFHYAIFMSDNVSRNFISKKVIRKILHNLRCRHFSANDLLEDLQSWIFI